MTNMNEIYKYRAFGLVISSEFPLVQIPDAGEAEAADITICCKNLEEYKLPGDAFCIAGGAVLFRISGIGKFRITGGSLIEVDREGEGNDAHLAVYLMGSCMGAILHQRGLTPFHGSCVTDGKRAVLLAGDSGAGKSTLASEFLSHGWKLLTDDVAAVENIETMPVVRSSYPSQKLWQDSLRRYGREKERIHSLYFDKSREKFGVAVADMFYEGTAPLSLVVQLIPADAESSIQPLTGFARVHQLMRNTYRLYMMEKEKQQQHFQRCVTLSLKVPMALVLREKGKQTSTQLYKMIVDFCDDPDRSVHL